MVQGAACARLCRLDIRQLAHQAALGTSEAEPDVTTLMSTGYFAQVGERR